jgi:hypothetical protein
MKKYIFGVLFFTISQVSNAAWVEASGEVNRIMTYATTDTILITLSSSGTSVPDCSNTSEFAISKSASEESRARMYAMALAAKTAGTTITVAYEESGGCEPWGSNTSVYRTIRRMR